MTEYVLTWYEVDEYGEQKCWGESFLSRRAAECRMIKKGKRDRELNRNVHYYIEEYEL